MSGTPPRLAELKLATYSRKLHESPAPRNKLRRTRPRNKACLGLSSLDLTCRGPETSGLTKMNDDERLHPAGLSDALRSCAGGLPWKPHFGLRRRPGFFDDDVARLLAQRHWRQLRFFEAIFLPLSQKGAGQYLPLHLITGCRSLYDHIQATTKPL